MLSIQTRILNVKRHLIFLHNIHLQSFCNSQIGQERYTKRISLDCFTCCYSLWIPSCYVRFSALQHPLVKHSRVPLKHSGSQWCLLWGSPSNEYGIHTPYILVIFVMKHFQGLAHWACWNHKSSSATQKQTSLRFKCLQGKQHLPKEAQLFVHSLRF